MPLNTKTDARLQSALRQWGAHDHRLLQVLRAVQTPAGYLSPEVLAAVADSLSVPLAQVRGVASFYSFLSTEPVGEFRVRFSDSITDRMDGSAALLDKLCRLLWAEPGHVAGDGLVSVATTSCTGLCDQGPAMLVNGRAIGRLDHARIERISELILARIPVDRWPADLFEIVDIVRRRDLLLKCELEPGDALAQARRLSPAELIGVIARAGLRGRGGAGFPSASKWAACAATSGPERYIVCNADEGEPGTFKDRLLLSRHADLIIEGMTLAGYAVGASHGLLYLRAEYLFLRDGLEQTLTRRRQAGLLGATAAIPFDVELHVGAGSYVCGEETALLESLEGRRGIPRNRPPYPVTHGYRDRPTVVDNVETFCAATLVLLGGAEAFRLRGTPQSQGTKLLSVAGDSPARGIYEFPFGVTVRQVLQAAGAEDAIAVQVGGPSGTCISVDEFDRQISFEDLSTGGAFTIFGPARDLFEVARSYAHFFAHESCGFCTPCRVGTSLLARVVDKIHAGYGTRHELAELEQLIAVLGKGSHCGLGHSAGNPIRDTLLRFMPAYERRLASADFAPAFNLDAALAPARRMTGRDDPAAHLGEGS